MKTSKLGGRVALVAALMQSAAFVAQPAGGAYAATQSQVVFNIPAGSLSSVVTAIAASAHEQIAFSSDLLAPYQAGPVRGRKSVRNALSEALSGTGLTVVVGSGGALAIRQGAPKAAAAKSGALDIADIDVTGNGSGMHDDGFQAGDSGATLRLGDTQLKEVPRSIGVVTKKVLDSQGVVSATDAAQYISGVTPTSGGAGSTAFTIRGFQSTGFAVNGLNSPSYSSVPIDEIERVEVLKGPTSILTGVTYDGGIVNLSTKRPTDQTIRDVTVRLGSYGYKTLAFDLGGAVPQTEGVTYRMNISGNVTDKNYAGYRNGHENPISPALQWQDKETTVLLGVRYSDERVLPPQTTFVPVTNTDAYHPILAVTRGVNEFSPDLHLNAKSVTAYNDVVHDFGSFFGADVTVNNHFQFLHEDVNSATYGWTTGGTSGAYNAYEYATGFGLDKITNRSDVTVKYDYGFAKQTSKFGFDITQNISLTDSTRSQLLATDVYAGGNYGVISNSLVSGSTYVTRYKTVNTGVYYLEKFDTFNDRLHILGQVRRDHFKTELDNAYYGSEPTASLNGTFGVSWTAGGAFDVTPWFTAYGNRSNGFLPGGVNVLLHTPLQPQHRDQSEVGGRFFLFDKRLTLTPTFYKLAATNVSIKDPSDPTNQSYIAVGGLQSRGFEFDAQGQITDALAVIASFSDVHTAYTTPLYSYTMPGIPQYTASLWATYTVQDGFARGFIVGFGGRGNTNSIIESSAATSFYKMPGYVVEDMMVGYEHDKYSIMLKINNLTNKYYYLPTYTASPITIAEGRNALLTMKYSF